MPFKGQNCANCAGDCCTVVAFTGAAIPKRKNGLKDFSTKKLRDLGYKEIYRLHDPCTAKTRESCIIYDGRPQLCRSYYCHGKYWRPKPHKQRKLSR